VSRLFREVTSPQQQADAVRLRNMMVTYAEVSDLIQIGAYKPGASQQVDRAVQLMPAVRHFLQQTVDERSAMSLTQQQLEILGKAWPW
jgi:flagellum-specific ATP synthase